MMRTYRIGVLGLTHDHIWHQVSDLASSGAVEVVHVADEHEDLLRKFAGHVAVGCGRHFCRGAHLARLEIRAICLELLGRLDHLELAGDPTWTHAYFVEGPKRIPIRYRVR